MNEEVVKKLEAAVASCATKAARLETKALEALQLTQAALNAANAIIGLTEVSKTK